jgi:hypothetical protein
MNGHYQAMRSSIPFRLGGSDEILRAERAQGRLYLQYISVPRHHLVEDRVHKEAQEQP